MLCTSTVDHFPIHIEHSFIIDLFFSSDHKEKLAKVKNLRINVYSKNLYKKEKIELKSIILKQVDFDLQIKDVKNFYNHLRKNIFRIIHSKN